MRFPGLRLLLFGAPRSEADIRLGHRRIFILPTRLGAGFGLLLLAMLVTAMNYQNNLAYAFVFLSASTVLTSAIHTYANLSGITLSPARPSPVFAGQTARFPVRIHDHRGTARIALEVIPRGGYSDTLDIPPSGDGTAEPAVATSHRGPLPAPELVLRTTYPLGFFRAWSKVRFKQDCMVYPRPAAPSAPSLHLSSQGAGSREMQSPSGEEDLDSLREHRSGESFKRIDWKAYARGRGLVSKHFAGRQEASVWLDFEALPHLGTEVRLSRLARAILDLSETGAEYGLLLPHTRLPPASGLSHMHACLTELALLGHNREAAS